MAETGSMVAANQFLQKNMPTLPGNIGIGYAQGGENLATQGKATESLGAEKQEGKISEGNLQTAKAELARQQGILQQKQAEKTQKQSEKAQKESERNAAQQRLASAQARLAEAQAAAARDKAEAEAARAAQAQSYSAPSYSAPVYQAPPPPPVYTPPPPPPSLPVYTFTFGNPPPSTGNSGSATSAMQAAARNAPKPFVPPVSQVQSSNTVNSGVSSTMSAITAAIKEAERQDRIRKGLQPPDAPMFTSGR
jgi:hypothetical protein